MAWHDHELSVLPYSKISQTQAMGHLPLGTFFWPFLQQKSHLQALLFTFQLARPMQQLFLTVILAVLLAATLTQENPVVQTLFVCHWIIIVRGTESVSNNHLPPSTSDTQVAGVVTDRNTFGRLSPLDGLFRKGINYQRALHKGG